MTEREQPIRITPEQIKPAPETIIPSTPEYPEYTATQKLWQKLLEVSEHSLLEEGADVVKSRAMVAKTFGELLTRMAKNPINIPGHYHEVDAYIRGRDPGDLKLWATRNLLNVTIGAAATGVDILNVLPSKFLESKGRFGNAVAGILEYTTDSFISYGSRSFTRTVTGSKESYYASPLSETISTFLNLIPGVRDVVDGVNLEAGFRVIGSIPNVGAVVERAYVEGNKIVTKFQNDKRNLWIQGLIMAASKGYLNPKKTDG